MARHLSIFRSTTVLSDSGTREGQTGVVSTREMEGIEALQISSG